MGSPASCSPICGRNAGHDAGRPQAGELLDEPRDTQRRQHERQQQHDVEREDQVCPVSHHTGSACTACVVKCSRTPARYLRKKMGACHNAAMALPSPLSIAVSWCITQCIDQQTKSGSLESCGSAVVILAAASGHIETRATIR